MTANAGKTCCGTVAEVLADLDRRFRGLRFCVIGEQDHVRRHVRVYVSLTSLEDRSTPLSPTDEVHVMGALTGGSQRVGGLGRLRALSGSSLWIQE